MLKKLPLFLFLTVLCAINTGCEEDDAKALSKAQKCLDELPSDLTDANNGFEKAYDCIDDILSIDTQQAYSIRCGGYLNAGGLDDDRIFSIGRALVEEDGSSSKIEPMEFAAAATLEAPSSVGGTDTDYAETALANCESSGLPSFVFLANASYLGTALNSVTNDLLDSNGDPDYTAIENAIDKCGNPDTGSNGADCAELYSAAPTIINSIESTYCTESNSGAEFCEDLATIQEETASYQDDAEDYGAAIICILNGGTYNAGSGSCS